MKRCRNSMGLGMCVLFLTVLFCGYVVAADITTVTGMINDDYQLVADNGEAYEVEINDVGNEMLDYVGAKVTVTGIVEEIGGVKTIIPESFQIIEKTTPAESAEESHGEKPAGE